MNFQNTFAAILAEENFDYDNSVLKVRQLIGDMDKVDAEEVTTSLLDMGIRGALVRAAAGIKKSIKKTGVVPTANPSTRNFASVTGSALSIMAGWRLYLGSGKYVMLVDANCEQLSTAAAMEQQAASGLLKNVDFYTRIADRLTGTETVRSVWSDEDMLLLNNSVYLLSAEPVSDELEAK